MLINLDDLAAALRCDSSITKNLIAYAIGSVDKTAALVFGEPAVNFSLLETPSTYPYSDFRIALSHVLTEPVVSNAVSSSSLPQKPITER